MAFDRRNVRKPIHELYRSLKSFPPDPPAEEVHSLRTRSRRVEAIAAEFAPTGNGPTRKMLKALKPLRRAAGKVRDMDVLERKALSLADHCRRASVERLVEQLILTRIEAVHALQKAMGEKAARARRNLKRFEKEIEENLVEGGRKACRAGAITEELSCWPELAAGNLHEFRIRAKELRYILQLTAAPDAGLLNALERVKSRIGDWHDWHEMGVIAHKTLDARKDRGALNRIARIEEKKLARALSAARALRTGHLGTHGYASIAEL